MRKIKCECVWEIKKRRRIKDERLDSYSDTKEVKC